jgi:hypothetical protein
LLPHALNVVPTPIFPLVTIVPDANKLLTALDPALNRPIVALVAMLILVIDPDDAVIEPDADKFPEVDILPIAVIVPDARKLLTALEPAVNFPRAAEVEDSPVIVPLV